MTMALLHPGKATLIGLMAAALILAALTSVHAQEPMPDLTTGVAVVFDGQTLFSVYSRLASFRPEERARIIAQRLGRLAADPRFDPESLTITTDPFRTEIAAGDVTIATVTEADARAVERPREAIASEIRSILVSAVNRYRESRRASKLWLGTLLALLAFCLFAAILVGIWRGAIGAHRWIDSHAAAAAGDTSDSPPHGGIGSYLANHLSGALHGAVSGVRLILSLGVAYAFFAYAFGQFPWTRGYAAALLGIVEERLAQAGSACAARLPDIVFILIVGGITALIIRLMRITSEAIERSYVTIPGVDPDLAPPTYRLLRLLALALAAVAILPYVPGFQSPAFQGMTVFAGALITLGSTSVVANLVAGIALVYMRPFRLGDRVKIGDTVGDVIARSDLVTRVRTVKNEDVTVPNSVVLGAHIVNYSANARARGLILHTSVTIGYDAPWRQVHGLLIAAAGETDGILAHPPPYVLQKSLNDFYVTYEINGFSDRPNSMASIYSELHSRIQDKFNDAGVEIMSPHFAALRDGNRTAIPADYLPTDYRAPGFRTEPSIDAAVVLRGGTPEPD